MLTDLNTTLRHLLRSRVSQLIDDTQIRFEPPDDAWRTYLSGLSIDGSPAIALNVYLIEVRENRDLRSNRRTRSARDGIVTVSVAPQRIDCHYWLTAWSGATASASVEPTLEEQQLLYDVTATFMNTELRPRAVFAPNPLPAGFSVVIADEALPFEVVPPEGHPKIPEIWSTFSTPYRPGVHLVVTLPVVLDRPAISHEVTTSLVDARPTVGIPSGLDRRARIAGRVLDSRHPLPDGSPAPVGNATIVLLTRTGLAVTQTLSSSAGEFTFGNLAPGPYRLRTSTPGLGTMINDIEVPSPSGLYDLTYV